MTGRCSFCPVARSNNRVIMKGAIARQLLSILLCTAFPLVAAGGVFRIRDREIVHADVSDSLAYTVNSYYYPWRAPEDEAQWHKTKNVHVWARDAEGVWKLRVDIWNSDVRLTGFADE